MVKNRTGMDAEKEDSFRPEKGRSLLYHFVKIASVFIILVLTAFMLNQYYKRNSSSGFIMYSSRDKKSDFVLSDGTTIWLNQGSTIRYPEKFAFKKRRVELTGEAFFEVTPNLRKPFIVSVDKMVDVKVVGTSFNILSESGSKKIIVHVVTGQVSFYDTEIEESGIIISKNEKGIYMEGKFEKTSFIEMNFLSWKSGVLIFENTPLDKVIAEIIHHYNQEIILELRDPESILFSSTFKEQPFNEVIEEIVLLLDLQYRYQNDTIILYK